MAWRSRNVTARVFARHEKRGLDRRGIMVVVVAGGYHYYDDQKAEAFAVFEVRGRVDAPQDEGTTRALPALHVTLLE
jgi:hypothetical protein